MTRGTPVEIAFWLGGLRRLPTVADIMARWQVHRATAYRWLAFARAGGRSQQADGISHAHRRSKP